MEIMRMKVGLAVAVAMLAMNMMLVSTLGAQSSIIDNDQMIELPSSKEENEVTKSSNIAYSRKVFASTRSLPSTCPSGGCILDEDCFPCSCKLVYIAPPLFAWGCA